MKNKNYWNNKDLVFGEASKYKIKCDFKKGSGGAYNSAIKHGWMDEISELYFKEKIKRFNYGNVHCVYVYEMVDFNTCYIGRTVDIHKRDLSHRRSRKHSNGSESFDSLYTFCLDKDIEIPTPIVLENKLTPLESLEKEDYWLNKYKDNGWNCLNIAKTGKDSGSLGSVKKWTYDECQKMCKNFQYKHEVKEYNYSCYYTCLKNNWFDEFGIKNKYTSSKIWESKEKCLEELNKYGSLKELSKHNYTCYLSMLKNNWTIGLNGKKELDINEIYSTYLQLHDVRKVASVHHTSYKKIKELFDKNDIRLNGHNDKVLLNEDIQNIVNDIKNGLSQTKCSEKYGIGKRRLKRICEENGVII